MGVFSDDNNLPLKYRGTSDARNLFDLLEYSSNSMTFHPRISVAHQSNNYLGAIVSQDWSVVYWMNNTRPLP